MGSKSWNGDPGSPAMTGKGSHGVQGSREFTLVLVGDTVMVPINGSEVSDSAGSLLNEHLDGLGWMFRRTEQVGSMCSLPSQGVCGKRLLSLVAVNRS